MARLNAKNLRTYSYFVALVALLIANSWLLNTHIQKIEEQEDWVNHTHEVSTTLEEVLNAAKDAEAGVRGYALTGDAEYLDLYEQGATSSLTKIAQLKVLTRDNATQALNTTNLERIVNERMSALKNLQGALLRNVSVKVSQDGFRRGSRVMESLRQQIAMMKAVESKLLQDRTEKADNSKLLFFWSLVATTFILIVVFSVAFYLFKRHLDLSEAEAAAKAREAKIKDRLAQVNSLLNGEVSLETASQQVLQLFINYLGAVGGQIFVQKNNVLRAVSSVGVHNADTLITRSKKHPGLIESALERKELWQIKDVPRDYWKVRTALGETQPGEVTFLPFQFQGHPIGVLELGTFRSLSDDELEFLTKAADFLGVGIHAIQSRDELQELLEETQAQSEELMAQQEELRAANEELEQQARVLESQQENLANQNTELEVQRQDIERKAHELELSSRYKSEFLAKMSHELRTPLNGIMILSTLLNENKEHNLTDQQRNFAQSIHSSGQDLLILINDILDLSKIEARKLTLKSEKVLLGRILEQLTTAFRPQAEIKGLKFSLDVSRPDQDMALITDRQRLEQILRNFLSNAIKFTEHGSITLSAKAEGSNVFITVKDTGVGIAHDKKDKIFEAFEQADSSISRKYGGTGLGLTISRELAHLLGGEITVDTQEGKGSSFTVTLPLVMAESPAVGPALIKTTTAPMVHAENIVTPEAKILANEIIGQVPAGSKTILIVEDDDKFREMVVDSVRSYGFHPLEAKDGEVALEILTHFTPSAALLDIKLPGISGMGLLEIIKQMPHLRHVPVHMISALDYQHNALQIGALGYLTKPVTIDKIRSAIDRLEGIISQQFKQVLVIEDDPNQGMAISELIAGADVKITLERSGKAAIQKLKMNVFDCVILDLSLPDVSGFDFLAEVNSMDISIPPIIIYTGKDLSVTEEKYLRQYSESIIIKGVRSPERLLDEVNLFLHRVESMLPADKKLMLSQLRSQKFNFEGYSVLLVDDDLRNIFALTSALETKGFNVRTAKNGQEALEVLEKHHDINLVLMDIMMPVMDGFEAMRRIRSSEDERLRNLPIVALTAKAMREDHEKCIEAGATDYLSKPVNLSNLMTIFNVWLPKEGALQ